MDNIDFVTREASQNLLTLLFSNSREQWIAGMRVKSGLSYHVFTSSSWDVYDWYSNLPSSPMFSREFWSVEQRRRIMIRLLKYYRWQYMVLSLREHIMNDVLYFYIRLTIL